VTIEEDRAERVNAKAKAIRDAFYAIRCGLADKDQAALVRLFAAEFIRLEDEIRALKDEVRLAASGGRDR
jgi:hypothetical protein